LTFLFYLIKYFNKANIKIKSKETYWGLGIGDWGLGVWGGGGGGGGGGPPPPPHHPQPPPTPQKKNKK